ncbi:MAG TPA: trigger factor [Anaerolineales bacterium]|nr:trigger factor [Anaerolineales bacterium]
MTPLKIETEDLTERQVQLTVEVPDEAIEAAMHRAARHLSRHAKIAGFRPGKAPYEVILQRYGEEAIFEEALDTLGQEIYRQALEDSALDPVAPGSLDDVVSRKPLVLRYTVPLTPEIDLGAYRDVRIPFETPHVTDDAVEELLESLRQQQALIEPADRPAGMSDVVVLDTKGSLHPTEPDGERGILMDEKGVSLLLAETTDFPFPGVSSHLVDRSAGESVDAEFTFPEDYPNEKLRGRSADFHFEIQAVKSRQVPDWSDDLVRNLGDFEDLTDLRAKVRKSLEERSLAQADDEYAEKVIQQVVDGSRLEYPPVLLRQEIDDTLTDLDRRLKEQRLTLADYLRIEKKSEDDIRAELEPQARRRLGRALVLGRVVEAEGLEVGDEDIDGALDRLSASMSDQSQQVRKALDQPAGRRRIALDLLTDKAVARLVQIARGEAPPPGEPTPPGDKAPEPGETDS